MQLTMKSKAQDKKALKFEREYLEIMKHATEYSTIPLQKSEWKQMGDHFIKFSLYDENQHSIATIDTSFI